jgi:Xaa-Pro aminopeptidase
MSPQTIAEFEPNFDPLLEIMRAVDVSHFEVASKEAKYADFPLAEYVRRYARACRLMEKEGLDALLVTQDLNVRYFSGYKSILWSSRFRPYLTLLPRDPSLGPTLILPGQETGNGLHTSWVADLAIYPDQENPTPTIAEAVKAKGLDRVRIGMELGFGQRLGLHIEGFEELKRALAPAEIVNGTTVTQAVRMLKSSAEVEKIRRACEISQAGVRAGWEELRPGISEKELVRVMGATMFAEGAELGTQPTFLCLAGGPERYRMANALASDYCVAEGDIVFIDGGAVYDGYATDFIRQACLGEPRDDQRRWFEVAIEANNACIEAIRPGVTGSDVYEAGMAVFEREGLLEFSVVNIVGHGTGMEIHELPWLGERDTVFTSGTTLQPGMVVCIEPVIAGMDGPDWRAGCFIVEEKVLVTETGSEVLTTDLPKDLWIEPVTEAAVA